MSFKKKMKKAFRNIIGDFTGVQWRDLDHKKVYLALAAVVFVIVLAVVLIAGALKGDKKTDDPKKPGTEEVQVTPTVTEEAEEDLLEKDVYPEVNELVKKYFDGLSSGDAAKVAETVDVLTDEEKKDIEGKKDYIEAYQNVTCHTKKGLEEDSFVVFASYEMKIVNIETPAPGIMALYVCKNAEGAYYIFNGEAPEELTNYVLALAAEEDVAAVIADVDARYQQLITEDKELGKFVETMLEAQKEQPAEKPEEPEEPTQETVSELSEPVSTTVKDNVRLRKERSVDSEMLDTLAAGTGVKVYISYADGWSKISYNDMVGYCKTEFLESTEGVPMESAQTEEPQTEEPQTEEPQTEEPQTEEPQTEESQTEESQTEDTQEEAPAENAEVTAVNKQMQFKEAVNIRAERSADSERITTGYEKELVKVIENYSDGWSKVNYNDMVGYCKTEFLEEAQ